LQETTKLFLFLVFNALSFLYFVLLDLSNLMLQNGLNFQSNFSKIGCRIQQNMQLRRGRKSA